MKLNEVKQILGTNGRSSQLLCIFTENTAPTLEFGNGYPECVHKRVDLKDYVETLKKMKKNEAFTLGREDYNNVDLGEIPDISRLHCYVVRDGEEFKLYDCSLFGTAVVL